MGKIKEFFHNKGLGFYVALVAGVISLFTAIIYVAVYGNYRSNNNEPVISWFAFVLLIVCFVLPIVASLIKFERFAPYGIFVCGLLALVFYIYHIYYHASVLMSGIELQDNKTSFFFITILMVVCFVLDIAVFFLPQNKKEGK